MKKKKLFSCIAIILAFFCLLFCAQAVLMPKYLTDTREGALVREYYHETSDHDVLFLGDCETYESFIPPTLWEEYGISSVIRGSAQQLLWQSYYLLKDTLRYETPKAVVLNVYAVKYGEPQNEAYNRMTLDGMRLSSDKIGAIRASMTEEENPASYLFPLLRFHSRWSELTWDDFRYAFSQPQISHNGYLMQTAVSPKTTDAEGRELLDYTLPAEGFDWLQKIADLCAEKGIELILVKAPTNDWRYWWYDEYDEQVTGFAEKNGLTYINFIPLVDEIGIDWTTDTYDGGVHLNVFGAEKLTSYFGKILSERFEVEDRRSDEHLNDDWNRKLERYNAEKEKGK